MGEGEGDGMRRNGDGFESRKIRKAQEEIEIEILKVNSLFRKGFYSANWILASERTCQVLVDFGE